MSYRAGVYGMSEPTISCDSPGCEARIVISGLPPRWFLDNRPPPKWYLNRNEYDGRVERLDLCEHHKPTRYP